MLSRLCLWFAAALLAIASLGLAQQPPQPTCEDRLQAAEKLLLILRDERDRAQQQMSQAWSLAERLEKAQKVASPKPEGEAHK